MSNAEAGPPVRRQQLQATEPEQVTLTLPDVIRHAGDAYNSRDWAKAEQLCRLVLGAQADYFDALNLLGIITAQTGRLEEAADLLKRAAAVQPDNVAALSNLGGLLKELKRFDEAMVQFDRAIAIKPDFAEAYNNRGIVLQELGQLDAAVASYDQAIGIRPAYAEAYGNRGVALRALKRLDAAVASFDKAIGIKPRYAEAYFNRGNALQELKQLDAAVASFDKAIGVKPDYAEAHYSRGVALQELNQLDAAVASFDMAIGIKPGYAEAFYERGAALQELNRLDAAVASFDKAIGARPEYAEAFANRGNALLQLKQLDAAVASYDRAIGIKPQFAEVHNNRGVALQALKQLDAALASYDAAIAINPDYAEACYNRGAALQELKKLDAAVASFDKAIGIRPDYVEAWYNRGATLQELDQTDAAVASFHKALGIKPDFPEACYDLGAALLKLNQPAAAVASFDKAIGLKPDYVDAHVNRGNALLQLKQQDAAVASYDKAIGLKPDYAEAHNNRGVALQSLKQLVDAIASYDKAIGIKPDYAEAWYNRGVALQELKQLDAAISSYDRAIDLKPDYEWLFGTLLHIRMHLCDWRNFAGDRERLKAQVEASKRVSPSFPILSLYDSPALQRQSAEIWIHAKHPRSNALGEITKKARGGKIRLGYYSADFRDHPVSNLLAGLFESHDRERFELNAFSFGPVRPDAMRSRISAAFDRFIDVENKSDREVAGLSREMGIDIAIDLGGLTADSRTGVFALRAAPIQVNYVGYPGTMGATYIDYIIGDRIVIPEQHRADYSEKIVYLPDTFQANDSKRPAAAPASRSQYGLDEESFVFCCFNNSYKLTPEYFQAWLRLLGKVGNSVLWLIRRSDSQVARLRRLAEDHGVSAGRIQFCGYVPYAEHLARYPLADLALDTSPFGGGATTSDALWCGVPVVTAMGNTFAGRMSASLLSAIGLPELVTSSLAEYEALAHELATHPRELASFRERLSRHRSTHPLFDTALFTRKLENAYLKMCERHRAGLSPDHIDAAAGARR